MIFKYILTFLLIFGLNGNVIAQDDDELLNYDELRSFATEALSQTKDIKSLNLDLLADQITSRNVDYLRYSNEPRNNSSVADYDSFAGLRYSQFHLLDFIQKIEDQNYQIEGLNASQKKSVLATLYFLKGITLGNLGLLHDSAVIADRNENYAINDHTFGELVAQHNLELSSYKNVVEAGVSDIEKAIEIINSLENEQEEYQLLFWQAPPGMNNSNFKKMAHSMVAKLLINVPRSAEEEVNYQRVLTHAKAGLDESYPNIIFLPENQTPSVEHLYDYYFLHANYMPECNFDDVSNCSAKFPVDVKVLHLLDSTYAKSYPKSHIDFESNTGIHYREAVSEDPRLAYFEYTNQPGYNGSGRILENNSLHSNYFSKRTYYGNDWDSENYPFVMMIKAELQYIIAECEFMLGNVSAANAALQNSPYGTVATDLEVNLPSVQLGILHADGYANGGPDISSDKSKFKEILHKEYAIEISALTTIGTHWFFMRRHNLLQIYTPLHFPPPDIALFDQEVYTHGGRENAGKNGTASGLGAWKKARDLVVPNFNSTHSLVGSETIILKWNEIDYQSYYPEDELPVLHITSTDANLDTIINDGRTELELTGLENEKEYTFYLDAISDYRESIQRDSISFVPNSFGLKSKSSEMFYAPLYEGREQEISLYNSFDEELVIDSVKLDLVNPDTTLYSDFFDFFEFEASDIRIPPNSEYSYKISFQSDLWSGQGIGPLKFTFNSDKGNSSYTYDRLYTGPYPRGLKWTKMYSAEDSISIGRVEVGEIDSIKVKLRNLSLKNYYIDSLYVNSSDDPSSSDPSSNFYFKPLDGRIKIEPYEWVEFWLYVEPNHEQPAEAYGYWDGILLFDSEGTGDFYDPRAIGHFYVNSGDRTVLDIDERINVPTKVELYQNYPNPFNPTTTIKFDLPNAAKVNLKVYNMLGREVAALISGEIKSAGTHDVQFNASHLSSGFYIYKLDAENTVITRKLVLIK